MIAYHGDYALKQTYLDRVREHRDQDQIVKGQYWRNGKGCAVGCTIHGSDHTKYESTLGIPVALAHIEDKLFEHLPNELAMSWPERFLDAIPVGADLSMVVPHFLYWLLMDETEGVIRFADERRFPRVRAAIQAVADLYSKLIRDESVDRQSWIDARRAAAYAASYASYAAYAAAYAASYAAVAADDAAYAASYAAVAVADAAYAADAARIHSRVRQSEKLLELLRIAPLGKENR